MAESRPPASPDSDVFARLRDIVEQVTQKMDGTTEHAEVVGSTRHCAERHVMGVSSPLPDRPVWVVQAVGDFVNHRARGGARLRNHPPRRPPHYRVLILMIDAPDYHLFSWSTRKEATDLTALGEVTQIDPQPSS